MPLPTLISASRLAAALDIPVNRIRALVDAGYLCIVNSCDGKSYRIVKSNPPDKIPARIVDRASIMLWLAGMDKSRMIPVFNVYIEKEIMRIARLQEPFKTEQAIRMLLRYRDAEEIVKAVSKARAGDVAAVEIERLSARYKRQLAKMSGLEGLLDSADKPNLPQAQAPVSRSNSQHRRQSVPASRPIPSNGHSGSPRTPRQ